MQPSNLSLHFPCLDTIPRSKGALHTHKTFPGSQRVQPYAKGNGDAPALDPDRQTGGSQTDGSLINRNLTDGSLGGHRHRPGRDWPLSLTRDLPDLDTRAVLCVEGLPAALLRRVVVDVRATVRHPLKPYRVSNVVRMLKPSKS